MLKDITLGQFFPGDTVVHRLDPRTKILSVIFYVAALFTAERYVSYAVMGAVLILCVGLSRIRPRILLRGLRPLVFILLLTAILNMFYTGGHVLFEFWIFRITREGLITAGLMMLRIMMLVCGTLLLTYTTSPLALTDGMERLLSPLKKLRVPVHDLAMIMSIALRFIPILIEETDRIMSAQRARGADFDTGSILRRAKALMPILIPLFVGAFRRADELAVAMECRCYQGGEGRTRMKVLQMHRRDWLTLLFWCAVTAGVVCLVVNGL